MSVGLNLFGQRLERGEIDMEKIKAFWEGLPKTVKVFAFLAVSSFLAEVIVELGGLEQTLTVRWLGVYINLIIVGVIEATPILRDKLSK